MLRKFALDAPRVWQQRDVEVKRYQSKYQTQIPIRVPCNCSYLFHIVYPQYRNGGQIDKGTNRAIKICHIETPVSCFLLLSKYNIRICPIPITECNVGISYNNAYPPERVFHLHINIPDKPTKPNLLSIQRSASKISFQSRWKTLQLQKMDKLPASAVKVASSNERTLRNHGWKDGLMVVEKVLSIKANQ